MLVFSKEFKVNLDSVVYVGYYPLYSSDMKTNSSSSSRKIFLTMKHRFCESLILSSGHR